MIRVKCPECDEWLEFPDRAAGSGRQCTRCGRESIVPGEVGPDGIDTAAAEAEFAHRDVYVLSRMPHGRPRLRERRAWVRSLVDTTRFLGCVVGAAFFVLGLLLLVSGGGVGWALMGLAAFAWLCADANTHRAGEGFPVCIFLLPILCVLVVAATGQRGPHPRPKPIPAQPGAWNGFRDLKWGTRAEDIAGLELESRSGADAVYIRPADTRPATRPATGQAPLHVTYTFHDGALTEVCASCSDPSSVVRFREEVLLRYGHRDADSVERAEGKPRSWKSSGYSSDGGEVELWANFGPSEGSVLIIHEPFPFTERDGSSQRAAGDSRPTTRSHR